MGKGWVDERDIVGREGMVYGYSSRMGGKWLEAIRESRNRIFLLLISMDLPAP